MGASIALLLQAFDCALCSADATTRAALKGGEADVAMLLTGRIAADIRHAGSG